MSQVRIARRALLSAVASFAIAQPALAQHKLEISLETSPNHVRNISVVEIAKELEKRAGGKLEVKVYHGAAKFKDTDIPKALNQGAVDMGIPVTFHLGKYISNYDAPDLPMFYGRSRQEIYKFCDGPTGKEIGAQLEKKIGVKIIGKWMDLGHAQTFTVSKELKGSADMANLKIRTPGGAGTLARYEVLGANPLKIAWPDVPQALQRGTIDGVMTTFESVRSAKLWDSGLKFGLENNQSFVQYVPMVSLKSWAKYPKDIQNLILTVWAEKIDGIRDLAAKRQQSALADGRKNGMTINLPSKEDTVATRKKLMAKQDELIKQLKIDPGLAKRIAAALDG